MPTGQPVGFFVGGDIGSLTMLSLSKPLPPGASPGTPLFSWFSLGMDDGSVGRLSGERIWTGMPKGSVEGSLAQWRFCRCCRLNVLVSSRNFIAAQKTMTHLAQIKGMVWAVL